jgi:hypothetical protein
MADHVGLPDELITSKEFVGYREETEKDRDIIALDVAIQLCCKTGKDLHDRKRKLEQELNEEADLRKPAFPSRLSVSRDRLCAFNLNMLQNPDGTVDAIYGWDAPSSTAVMGCTIMDLCFNSLMPVGLSASQAEADVDNDRVS